MHEWHKTKTKIRLISHYLVIFWMGMSNLLLLICLPRY